MSAASRSTAMADALVRAFNRWAPG
jgi:hypothetical protein